MRRHLRTEKEEKVGPTHRAVSSYEGVEGGAMLALQARASQMLNVQS